MRILTFTLFSFLLSITAVCQKGPINFEADGNGASWTWNVFENSTNPPLEFIDNPSKTGINTTDKVAKFTALKAGNPWAGTETVHGASALGPFVLNATNSTIKIMVWKSVISDVGIKLVASSGWALPELKVANTVINQWEEITFNFSGFINPPASEGVYDQIVVFPDFNLAGRRQDNEIYFDNITFSQGTGIAGGPNTAAPLPIHGAADVISVFSNSYDNIPGTNLNPAWGQATTVTQLLIEGNNTLKYAGLNYQGTELGSAQNLTNMDFLHLDFWTANSTALNVFLISPGPAETPFALTVPTTGWSSVDIPLSAFSAVDLSNVIQLKFDGNGDIFLDNIYFHKSGGSSAGPNAPINFEPDGFGANWTWNVFENSTNPPLEFIDNPSKTGINTSNKVAKFTALNAGNPWAGTESVHGDTALGSFVLNATNSTIKIMVWKSVISDVGIKLVAPTGWAMPELKVANTLINQWEELTFDFSVYMNPPASEGAYDQIVVFPDFNLAGRGQDNITYFDNITFNPKGGTGSNEPLTAAPTPTRNPADVISMFSNAYTNVPVDTWRTDWSAAVLTDVNIEGNATKKYSNLDFVGIETVANQLNLSAMTHIHLDVWSSNFTNFGVKLVDFGADGAFGGNDDVEHLVSIPMPAQGQWVSLDLPLVDFTGLTRRLNVAQYILVAQPSGSSTVYMDNMYFYKPGAVSTNNVSIENITFSPNPVSSGADVQLNDEMKQIDVYNISGQLLHSNYKTNKIQTDGLKSGMYIIKIRTNDNKWQTGKLTVH